MKKFIIVEKESGMHSPPVIFIRACLGYKKIVGRSIKNVLWYSKDGHFKWAYIADEFCKVGKIILDKTLAEKSFYRKISTEVKKLSQQLNKFSNNLKKQNLVNKSNKFFIQTCKDYYQILENLYFWGGLIECMDVYHNFFSNLFKKELERNIEKKKNKQSSAECFSILTTLTRETFAQKQEKDFLKLAIELKNNKNLKNSDEFNKKINQHLNKYVWVNYNYEGPAMDKESLLNLLKHAVNANPEKKLKEIEIRARKDKQKKKKVIQSLKPDTKLKYLIELAGAFPTLKSIRKESIFHSCYAVDILRAETGKRLGLSLNEVRCMLPEEFIKTLKSDKVDKKELTARAKEMAYHMDNGKEKIYTGQKAQKIAKENIVEEKMEAIDEITGNPACLGRALGIVKVIKFTKDIGKMKQGDILVAMATNPTFVPAMKKAGAIITDMGGITCHAAIVSREMNIPCIIGTKIATKVLKDGQLVKVDANKGVVKIIKE